MNNESKFDSIYGLGTRDDFNGKEPFFLIPNNSMSDRVHQVKRWAGYAGLAI